MNAWPYIVSGRITNDFISRKGIKAFVPQLSSVRSLKGLKRNGNFAVDDGHLTLHPVPVTSVPFLGAVTEEQCL